MLSKRYYYELNLPTNYEWEIYPLSSFNVQDGQKLKTKPQTHHWHTKKAYTGLLRNKQMCFLCNVFKQKMCNFDSRKRKSEEKKDRCINDYV